jgi:hypothetical protein
MQAEGDGEQAQEKVEDAEDVKDGNWHG